MKIQNALKQVRLLIPFIFLASLTILMGCSDDDADPTSTSKSYTVTVGVYLLNGSTYEDQNKNFVFDTQEACQSWSRTAEADTHNSSSHDHFNAAKNTTYNSSTETKGKSSIPI
jgi:hypothetical protein